MQADARNLVWLSRRQLDLTVEHAAMPAEDAFSATRAGELATLSVAIWLRAVAHAFTGAFVFAGTFAHAAGLCILAVALLDAFVRAIGVYFFAVVIFRRRRPSNPATLSRRRRSPSSK